MRRVIRFLGYCVIGFIVVILSSYAFAQEKPVELTTVIAKIPTARIIDWEGEIPTVDGQPGWQEQALSVGNEVCCPAGQTEDDFVLVALNRSADNLVRLSISAVKFLITAKFFESTPIISLIQPFLGLRFVGKYLYPSGVKITLLYFFDNSNNLSAS